MRGTKVLIIDDNIDLTTIVSMILTGEGCLVKTCNTTEEGLFYLKDWKPHVLLLDVNIDGEDGRILCQKIKSTEGGKIKIILMSGDESTLEHSAADGADDYIAKPFESSELLQKILLPQAPVTDT